MRAAEEGDLESVKIIFINNKVLLRANRELKEIASKKSTLVKVNFLKTLVDDDLHSAILTAVTRGQLAIAKYLIAKYERLFDIHLSLEAIFEHAVHYGHMELVKCLSVKLDITFNDNKALKLASQGGYLDIVKYLVKKGADVTAEDNYSLELSIQGDHIDVVKYLVEQGADVAAKGSSFLQVAALEGHSDIVKYLIAKGADPSAIDNFTLRMINKLGFLDLVKYFISIGCDYTIIKSSSKFVENLILFRRRLNILYFLLNNTVVHKDLIRTIKFY